MPTLLPLQPGSWPRPVTDDEGSSGRQRCNTQGDLSFLMEAIKPFNYFAAALFVSRQFPTSTRQPVKSCEPHSQLINQGGESNAAQVFLADPAHSTSGRGDGVMYRTPTNSGDMLLLYQEAQPLRAAPHLRLEGSTASRELTAGSTASEEPLRISQPGRESSGLIIGVYL